MRESNNDDSGLKRFILHIHPRNLPGKTLKYTHTFGLGGMLLVLFLIQVFTGLLLKFRYIPVPSQAYDSILYIQNEIVFGQLIRNIHHWSGTFMIIGALLHLFRVFFTSAFHPPRQFNWIIGLILMVLILGSNFTGYLQPWDQLSFWAITISTSMLEYIPFIGDGLKYLIRGGEEVGPATLRIFYALHSAIFPAALFVLMLYHFWRIRKAKGVVIPKPYDESSEQNIEYVPTVPNLVLRELVVALILIAFVLLFSLLFDAPLLERANPGMSPNPAKAPWYFLGIQEMIMHFNPMFAVFIIPLLFVFGMIMIPYFKYESLKSGAWFISVKGKRLALLSLIQSFIITIIWIILDEFIMDFPGWMPGLSDSISNGVIPMLIMFAILFIYYKILRGKLAASKKEAVQAMFIFIMSSFILLTITSIWFRGEGMALVWP